MLRSGHSKYLLFLLFVYVHPLNTHLFFWEKFFPIVYHIYSCEMLVTSMVRLKKCFHKNYGSYFGKSMIYSSICPNERREPNKSMNRIFTIQYPRHDPLACRVFWAYYRNKKLYRYEVKKHLFYLICMNEASTCVSPLRKPIAHYIIR